MGVDKEWRTRCRRPLRRQEARPGSARRSVALSRNDGPLAASAMTDDSARGGIRYGPRAERRRLIPREPRALNGLKRPLLCVDSDLGGVLDTNPCLCAWPSAGVSSWLLRRPRMTELGRILEPSLDMVDCLLAAIRVIAPER
jgi:hypothetical protein